MVTTEELPWSSTFVTLQLLAPQVALPRIPAAYLTEAALASSSCASFVRENLAAACFASASDNLFALQSMAVSLVPSGNCLSPIVLSKTPFGGLRSGSQKCVLLSVTSFGWQVSQIIYILGSARKTKNAQFEFSI